MKVAVVGSGVSGLSATWLLNEYSDHEVHLFESDSRPGGHANTVRYVPPGSDEGVDVDTGFIVCNPSTYPNFLRFLALNPKIEIVPTEMTFSVSRDSGKFEWAGNNLFTVFCQPTRILDPNMWSLLYDVLRFNASARRLIAEWNNGGLGFRADYPIGRYLERERYSASFKDNYLVPMTAAIWSTPPDKCFDDFPARTLLQFLHNHHLLQITGKPSWLTIKGGSHKYVNAVLFKLPKDQLHLATKVKAVSTGGGDTRVRLRLEDGREEHFDHVIMACHSDTTLGILKSGEGLTSKEAEILGSYKWNSNVATLHSDTKLMPQLRPAWSCWNYLTFSAIGKNGKRKANVDRVSLTYGMNALQHISEQTYGPVLVTLNPPFPPNEANTFGSWKYEHPVLDGDAAKSQLRMNEIQAKRGITYAGAWMNFGFHEDGFTSGLLAALKGVGSSGSSKGSVRMPFKLQFVPGSSWAAEEGDFVDSSIHHGEGIISQIAIHLLAISFDIFEWSGLRFLVGSWMSLMLGFAQMMLGVNFDD